MNMENVDKVIAEILQGGDQVIEGGAKKHSRKHQRSPSKRHSRKHSHKHSRTSDVRFGKLNLHFKGGDDVPAAVPVEAPVAIAGGEVALVPEVVETLEGGKKRHSKRPANKFAKSMAKAHRSLGLKGFVPMRRGSPLYRRTMEIYKGM